MKMKKLSDASLADGELYLFSETPETQEPESCLWGTFDRMDSGRIRLEHMARDLRAFDHNLLLPEQYGYVRRASRSEVRDFYYLLGCDDALIHASR